MDKLMIKYDGEWVPRELCTIDRDGGADDCEICRDICKSQMEHEVLCKDCPIQKCFDRLAAYEDTGLTPERIVEMDKLYREKCEEVTRLSKELEEFGTEECQMKETRQQDKPITNYDKIMREMTPDELVEILILAQEMEPCDLFEFYGETKCEIDGCKKCILEYLQEEVKADVD